MNSPHNGQWRGALIYSLICAWINGWVNNCETVDLRRHRAQYEVTLMLFRFILLLWWFNMEIVEFCKAVEIYCRLYFRIILIYSNWWACTKKCCLGLLRFWPWVSFTMLCRGQLVPAYNRYTCTLYAGVVKSRLCREGVYVRVPRPDLTVFRVPTLRGSQVGTVVLTVTRGGCAREPLNQPEWAITQGCSPQHLPWHWHFTVVFGAKWRSGKLLVSLVEGEHNAVWTH